VSPSMDAGCKNSNWWAASSSDFSQENLPYPQQIEDVGRPIVAQASACGG
jgi:hypothetical protein